MFVLKNMRPNGKNHTAKYLQFKNRDIRLYPITLVKILETADKKKTAHSIKFTIFFERKKFFPRNPSEIPHFLGFSVVFTISFWCAVDMMPME